MEPTGTLALTSTSSRCSANSSEIVDDFKIQELSCPRSAHAAKRPEHLLPGRISDSKVSHPIGPGREHAKSLPEPINPGPTSLGICFAGRLPNQMRSGILSEFTLLGMTGVEIGFFTQRWRKTRIFTHSKILPMSYFHGNCE